METQCVYDSGVDEHLLRLGSEVIDCDEEGKEEGGGVAMSGRPAD